ncbi:DapH/DapD/GlmU-related protein [Candidatus Thalassolituus haligoni]|uniref:acyltransferase n=1 Tax=Candidatus Thalassolituus haligoni TaxID=3100113 RepID=UPI00351790ED
MIRVMFYKVRNVLLFLRIVFLRIRGCNIDYSARVSFKARIDFTNSKGVVIEKNAHVTFDAIILTHDFTRKIWKTTTVKENSFIGAGSILLPGVTVGPQSIVAAGSVVTKDVPPNSIVAGNPAKVIREGVELGKLGRIINR